MAHYHQVRQRPDFLFDSLSHITLCFPFMENSTEFYERCALEQLDVSDDLHVARAQVYATLALASATETLRRVTEHVR